MEFLDQWRVKLSQTTVLIIQMIILKPLKTVRLYLADLNLEEILYI